MRKTKPVPLQESTADEAVWSTAHANDLPDSAFAYIEPGGKKDDEGKTTPRSLRHLPYKDAGGKVDAAHVRNALARLSQTQIPADAKASAKHKLVAAAKSVGVEVSDESIEDAKESALSSPSFLPKSKIATLTTCWLEDGAISLNGRQYPREAVDRLIQSAQIQLTTPGATPLTCYISHDAADHDDSLKLVGKITNVWREGARAMAAIDIANTQAGRDAATLAANGYLCTQSLRASNAEIRREKDSVWPTIGGSNLHLDGIDFTATPGIAVAKIQNVTLAESAPTGPQKINEVFNAHAHTLVEDEQKEASMKIDEADQGGNTVGGYSPTSGNSQGMTSDPTQDSYGQRQYKAPEMTSGAMQGMDKSAGLQEAHDRIAMVQGRSCAPSRESVQWKLAFAGLEERERQIVEAGRSLSGKNDKHLDIAHDGIAKHLGMECEGKQNKMGYSQPADDGMQDGDDDDRQSHRQPTLKENKKPMSLDEARRLLEASGQFDIAPKKTESDQLREQMEAMKADQARQLEEMRALIQQQAPNPQRKSVVLGANVGVQQSNRANVYQPGKYLKEQIAGADWGMLADRTAPLPDGIDLTLLIREFTDLRVIQNFDRYGWPENLATAIDRL